MLASLSLSPTHTHTHTHTHSLALRLIHTLPQCAYSTSCGLLTPRALQAPPSEQREEREEYSRGEEESYSGLSPTALIIEIVIVGAEYLRLRLERLSAYNVCSFCWLQPQAAQNAPLSIALSERS